jgi:4-hydroxybenzoate polyprenyltransferase
MSARWWTYQRERFPVVGHGALILAFSASAVGLSALLRHDWPAPRAFLVAFLSSFLFFFQLRVADEFKDAEDDRRYRPYRAVPRGLVTLDELWRLSLAAGLLQVLLALWLDLNLIGVLVLVWGYMALMGREFFAPAWLKARPSMYLVSHMAVVTLIDLYATACDWLPHAEAPPAGLGWFLAASFFNGVVVEIGRKLRAPDDEEVGVETYSALWGRRTALNALLAALVLAAACATLAGRAVGVQAEVTAAGTVAVGALVAYGLRFLRDPQPGGGKVFEVLSGVWTLAMYLSVGVLPLVLRWWLAR